jgi:DtxR family Mn-dependent transcriptional regulator
MSQEELSSTMEDYLETIFNLEKVVKAVRVKDIAGKMKVKLPTVTSMLNTLGQRGLVNHEKYEYVELTREGESVAKDVYRRHVVFRDFLKGILKIDSKTAEEDACKMEHAISPLTLERFVKFMEFIETCPRGGSDWPFMFGHYLKYGRRDEDRCLKQMKTFEGKFSAEVKKLESKKE